MRAGVHSADISADGRVVRITRPEKILFPADGIDKRGLAEYYERIAPVMLPYLRDRPVTMERYPDGIEAMRFIQKKASPYFPKWIRTASMKKKDGSVRHVICNDAATLVYLAGQASITPHVWLSRTDRPRCPDQMIFDLDPPEGGFRIACRAALKLRGLLEEEGLEVFVKSTGSRGLHVLVPLNRRAGFDRVRFFARGIAQRLVEADPEHLTTDVRKSKRAGRLFIDTARNSYAQTAAPPYAVRPRPGAPVAVPLDWKELENPRLRPAQYTIRNVFERLQRKGDLWKGLAHHACALPSRASRE